MTYPRNAAAAAGTAAGNDAAMEKYASQHNPFEAEARAILAAEANANAWPADSWQRFVPALAERLAHPRVGRRRVRR